MSQIQLYYLFHVHISFYSPNIFNNETNSTVLSFLHHILFNSSMYSKVQQSQWSFLGLHSHLFQQSHLFYSVTNSVVLSNFTFISHSTVPHIQPCNKFNCLISFYILIYFISVTNSCLIWFNSRTYSTVSQIQCIIYFHVHILFPQSHTFNSVTNLVVLSTFTFISHSTVPTYSTMKQIQQSYLI